MFWVRRHKQNTTWLNIGVWYLYLTTGAWQATKLKSLHPSTTWLWPCIFAGCQKQTTNWWCKGPPVTPKTFVMFDVFYRCPFRSRCFPFTTQCCWELNQPTSYRFKLANLQLRDFRNGKCWKVGGIQSSSLWATPKLKLLQFWIIYTYIYLICSTIIHV